MAKITEEEKIRREEEKEAKRIEKEIIYSKSHFFIVETDKDGNKKKVPLSGTYTDKSVVFTHDGNGYIVIVDSTIPKVHKEMSEYGDEIVITDGTMPFVKTYTRCKETSKMYGVKSQLTSLTKKYNFGLIEEVSCNMSFDDMLAKARNCKGYKQSSVKRIIEVTELCVNKAMTVARKKIEAVFRTIQKNGKKIDVAA